MEEIQVLLGHKSISTTSDTYVHTNLESIAAHMREAVGDLEFSLPRLAQPSGVGDTSGS